MYTQYNTTYTIMYMYAYIQFSEFIFCCMYVCSLQTLWDCITYHRVLHWRRLNLFFQLVDLHLEVENSTPFCHYADLIWMTILLRFHGYSSLIISRQYYCRADVVVF